VSVGPSDAFAVLIPAAAAVAARAAAARCFERRIHGWGFGLSALTPLRPPSYRYLAATPPGECALSPDARAVEGWSATQGSAGGVGGSVLDTIVGLVASVNPVLASFVISFVFNAIPFATVPYLVVIASYAAVVNDVFDKLLMTVSGGLGAALGKMVVFYLGRGITHFVSENVRENLEFFAKFFERGVFIAVFLFAALPLPDDVLYVPLGMAGYNPVLFFTAVALGKMVITGASITFGTLLGDTVSQGSPLLVMVVGIAATVVISRMDWKRVVKRWQEQGALVGLVEMVVQFFAAMLPRRYGRVVVEKADSLMRQLGLLQ